MAGEQLVFDVFTNDRASAGLTRIGEAAHNAAGSVGDLSGKLDRLNGRVATARVGLAGDKEAQAQLDKITAQLLALNGKIANPKITPEGAARAVAEISAVDVALDRLAAKSAPAAAAAFTGLASKAAFTSQILAMQSKNTDALAAGTLSLVAADKLLADAEHVLSDEALAADYAEAKKARTLADAAKAASAAEKAAKAAAVPFPQKQIPLFGGLFGTVPLIGTVTGLHLIAQAVADVTAVVVPATVAFAAFGIAAVPTVRELYGQLKNVQVVSEATGKTIPPLTGGFERIANAVKPQVYVLFGEALSVVNAKAGTFMKLATSAGTVVDQLGQRIASALKSGGMSAFLQNAAGDLSKLGDVIGNIFGTIGNLLKTLPGYAGGLLTVLDSITKGLEWATGNVVSQNILKAGLAMHGFALYAGLAASGLLTFAPAVARAATWAAGIEQTATATSQLAANASRLDKTKAAFADIGHAISGTQVAIVRTADGTAKIGTEAATGATAFARFAALAARVAASPWTWAVVAAVAVGVLAVKLFSARDALAEWITGLQGAINIQTTFTGVIGATKIAVDRIATAQAGAASSLKILHNGQATFGAGQFAVNQQLNQQAANYVALKGGSQQYRAELALEQTRLSELTTRFGSVGKAQAIFNALHLKSIDIGKASDAQWNSDIASMASYETAVRAVAQAMGRSGTAQYNAALNALNNTFLTGTLPAITQVTTAETNLMTVVLGGRQGFITFLQDMRQMGADSKLTGASISGLSKNSLILADDFYTTAVPAAQALIGKLQQQGISTKNLTTAVADEVKQMIPFAGKNTEARSVLVSLINNALGPGTVSLKTLNKWVGQNSSTLAGFNSIIAQSTIHAGTLANVLKTQLNQQFYQALLQTSGADKALAIYTGDLVHNRDETAKGRTDRQHLITDLENAGLSAKQARDYVDGLQTNINKLHGKKVSIAVTGSGSWHVTGGVTTAQPGKSGIPGGVGAAQGMLVSGGVPGKDSVPILAMPGEAIVPKHLTPAVAPFLKANKVPGFAQGGVVGSYSGSVGGMGPWLVRMDNATLVALEQATARATLAGMQAAMAAASASRGGGSPGFGIAPSGPLQSYARQLLAAYGWASQWPQFNDIVMRESGWNVYATNPSSGAYGIPQALPASKMASAGADWRTNGFTQLRWMMGYIKCMPLDTEILTRNGWKRYDELQPTDETLGYNPETGKNEWTPILGVNVYDDAPLVRLTNKTWSAVCTPNHRWMSSHLHKVDGRRRVNGVRVPGKSTSFRADEFVPADEITSFHSLRLAAEAEAGTGPAISEGEAELLGWVMGDGSVVRYDIRQDGSTELGDAILRIAQENPDASYRAIGRLAGCTHQTVGAYLRANGQDARNGSHQRTGTGSMRRISLSQAKPERVKEIDALLAAEGIMFRRFEQVPRGIARLPKVEWRLLASYSDELLKRSGYDHEDPVPFVLSLSRAQRKAFLQGVFAAEGYQGKPQMAFGRGPYPSQRLYTQADGPQQDAICMALYLGGQRPAYHSWSASSRMSFGKECRPGANIGAAKPFIGGRAIRREDAGHAPVWCPTTALGTWTCRQGRQVFLTGNSRWGSPASADANEIANHWYGHGLDTIIDRPTVIGVGERGREHVKVTPVASGDSSAHQKETNALLRQVLAELRAAPGRTGDAVGGALNGVSRGALQAGRYSSR